LGNHSALKGEKGKEENCGKNKRTINAQRGFTIGKGVDMIKVQAHTGLYHYGRNSPPLTPNSIL
jgi:hypothetical protein